MGEDPGFGLIIQSGDTIVFSCTYAELGLIAEWALAQAKEWEAKLQQGEA